MNAAVRWIGVLAALLGACASPEKPEGPPPLPYELEGNTVGERRLRFAARREMASFEKHGRRKADLADAAYAMELELRRRGYAHAEVDFRLEPTDEAPEKVVFEIDEGPLGRIGQVSFPGEIEDLGLDLRKFLPSGDEPPFVRAQIDSAVGEIERSYMLLGYRNAVAGPPVVTWNEEKTLAAIVIPVVPGARYVIEGYTVEGDLRPSLEERFLAPLVGTGFYLRIPAEAASFIRAELRDRGHQKAAVTVETKYDENRVHLHFRVDEGPVYRVREVRITGQRRTREKFIRSRIPLHEGDVADQSDIADGIDRLYRTGVFRTVDVTKSYPEEREMDIEFALEELEARSVSFEVGWGSYELLRGGVRFQDRNFLGFGRRLDLEARASTVGYEVGGSISDNYLLGYRNTLRLAGGLFVREEPSFTRTGYNISLSVTNRLSDEWKFTTGYSLDSQEASDVRVDSPEFLEGEFLTSAGLFATIVYDSRDSSLIPTKGSVGEAGVLWSEPVLGADLNYLGLRASWFSFFSINNNITIGTGFRFETRPILDNLPNLPIQKRLFLGGSTTVRSFDQSRLGPFDEDTNEPTGGLTSLSGYVEGRIRVWRELHCALFYDIGMVSRRSLSIQDPWGQGIGAGLRYYLPVGPIRIDVAYNPGELFSNGSRWEFHLAFGFSF